jgi:hypothetical protein
MATRINVLKMAESIKMKLDVIVNIIQSVEIVICAIQLIMMHHGNQLVLLMHIHAKVCLFVINLISHLFF